MGRRALAVSLAAHAAFLLVVARLPPRARDAPAAEAPSVLEVEMLAPPAATPAPAPPEPEAGAAPAPLPPQALEDAVASARLRRPASEDPATSGARPHEAPVAPPPESRPLTMRAPAPAGPLLSPDVVARMVAPRDAPRPAPTPTNKLPDRLFAPPAALEPREPSLADLFTAGPYKREDDKQKPRFFSDYTPADMNQGYAASGFFVDDVATPIETPSPKKDGPGLGKPTGGGRSHLDRPAFEADVDGDGTVTFHDKPAIDAKVLPCLHGKKELRRCADNLEFPLLRTRFDLNDWLEHMAGNDPYIYEKQKFLEATREERMKMARAALRERLRDAVRAAPALLRAVWSDTTVTAVERRRMIFQLWDECAEEGDSDILVAARAFRGTILAFVHRRLPPGSADAYPPEELEALNKGRLSRARFDPYGAP